MDRIVKRPFDGDVRNLDYLDLAAACFLGCGQCAKQGLDIRRGFVSDRAPDAEAGLEEAGGGVRGDVAVDTGDENFCHCALDSLCR